MMDTPYYDQAQIAALLEKNFSNLADMRRGSLDHIPGLEGFELIDTGEFAREEYLTEYPDAAKDIKAITLRDADGNIYVHFKGTGDGNWGYNAAAYGPQNGSTTSAIQDWSLEYFNRMVQTYYEGQSANNLYVSGHSQGGNNAQFVTIRSQYGDYITSCVELDGPGFSTQLIEETKNLYGEAYYEQQRGKIYAYNGVSDFVSCLGQEQIIPEGHTFFVQTPQEYTQIMNYHHVAGMLDENGKLRPITDQESDFRVFIGQIAEQIKTLPPEQQARAAELAMKFAENYVGAEEPIKVYISAEDLEEFKTMLLPLLIEVLEQNPDMIQPVLQEIGVDPAIAELISVIINEFNDLPEEVRQQALQAIAECAIIEDGKVAFQLERLDILPAIKAAGPVLIETALHHPQEILNVLHTLGVDEMLVNYLNENPGVVVAMVLLAPLVLPLAAGAAGTIVVIDAVVHFVQGVAGLANNVKKFIVNCMEAVKSAIGKLKEFLHSISAGNRYANTNPSFKADTGKLRDYAVRINNVNSRLRTLDSDLRGLYWQVGLLDILDILTANLVTSESPTLNQVRSYLNNAADRLETAERKALGYMGG